MAGGTHGFDMIKRLKENENLRKLNYFKAGKRYPASGGTTSADKRTLTKEDTERLIHSIKHDQKAEKLRRILILGVSILLCGALILFLLVYAS